MRGPWHQLAGLVLLGQMHGPLWRSERGVLSISWQVLGLRSRLVNIPSRRETHPLRGSPGNSWSSSQVQFPLSKGV